MSYYIHPSARMHIFGNITLSKTKKFIRLYKIQIQEGSVQRIVYFGNAHQKIFLGSGNPEVKEDWYRCHRVAIEEQLSIGNYFAPVILEWKILYNHKSLRKSMLDLIDFLS